jgi:hypothetical protein
MWGAVLWIAKVLLFLIGPFIFMTGVFILIGLIKGKRFKKGVSKKPKKRNALLRLLYDFPKQYANDLFNRDPDYYKEYGVHVIAGKQGSGKTVTLAYLLRYYKQWYPNLRIKTNFGYILEDGQIEHWTDMVASNNGTYGEIDCIDEVQNWFNSLASKDFPPEMMTEITQQRKQRKSILCTSQVFTRIAKAIREQTYLLYEPITAFGCLTIVRVFSVLLNADGLSDKKKLRKLFFFVQDEELRSSFDTFRKIEKMIEIGFKDETQQIRNEDNQQIQISERGRNIRIRK